MGDKYQESHYQFIIFQGSNEASRAQELTLRLHLNPTFLPNDISEIFGHTSFCTSFFWYFITSAY